MNYHRKIFRRKTLSYLSGINLLLTTGFIVCGFIGLFLNSALLAPAFFIISAMALTVLVSCILDKRSLQKEIVVTTENEENENEEVPTSSPRAWLVILAASLVFLYSTYVGLSSIIGLSFFPIIPISVITISIMAALALVIFGFGYYRASFERLSVFTEDNSTKCLIGTISVTPKRLKADDNGFTVAYIKQYINYDKDKTSNDLQDFTKIVINTGSIFSMKLSKASTDAEA